MFKNKFTNKSKAISPHLISALESCQKVLYILGNTASGKTTLAKNLAKDWTSNNKSVCVFTLVNPHTTNFKHEYEGTTLTDGLFFDFFGNLFNTNGQRVDLIKGFNSLIDSLNNQSNSLLILDEIGSWLQQRLKAQNDLTLFYESLAKAQKIIIIGQTIPLNYLTKRPLLPYSESSYLICRNKINTKLSEQLENLSQDELFPPISTIIELDNYQNKSRWKIINLPTKK